MAKIYCSECAYFDRSTTNCFHPDAEQSVYVYRRRGQSCFKWNRNGDCQKYLPRTPWQVAAPFVWGAIFTGAVLITIILIVAVTTA